MPGFTRHLVSPSPPARHGTTLLAPVLLALNLCLLPTPGSLVEASPTFDFASSFDVVASGGHAETVAMGDVDQDGYDDLIIGNANGPLLSIFLSGPMQDFSQRLDFEYGVAARALAPGDFDNDGILDVAVFHFLEDQRRVTILHGHGDGSFRPGATFTVNKPQVDLLVADLNNDGSLDLVIRAEEQDGVDIRFGNGAGQFSEPNRLADGCSPKDVVCTNFDGDAYLDLAVSNYCGYSIKVFYGHGPGDIPRTRTFATARRPDALAAGDLNDDGHPDLAVTTQNSISVFYFHPGGAFTGGVLELRDYDSEPVNVLVDDLNNDSLLDVVALWRDGTLSLYAGRPGADFEAAEDFDAISSRSAIITDLDRDGRNEVVIPSRGVAIVRRNEAGSFGGAGRLGVDGSVLAVVHADFDDDGRVDFAVGHRAPTAGMPDRVTLFLGEEDRSYRRLAALPVAFGMQHLRAADLDRDGLMDLMVAGSSLQALLGDGGGQFTFGPRTEEPVSALALSDFDRDGIVDLAATSAGGYGQVSMRRGLGDGSFATPVTLGQELGVGLDMRLADMDDDGILDIVIPYTTYWTSGGVGILRSRGDGSFDGQVDYTAYTSVEALAVARVDSDRHTDMVLLHTRRTGEYNSTTWRALRRGVGPLEYAPELGLDGGGANRLYLHDLDGDAVPELVETSHWNTVGVSRGQGAGSFGPPQYFGAGSAVSEALIADFDNDGLDDIATTNLGSKHISILWNQQATSTANDLLEFSVAATAAGVELSWILSEPERIDRVLVQRAHNREGPYETRTELPATSLARMSYTDHPATTATTWYRIGLWWRTGAISFSTPSEVVSSIGLSTGLRSSREPPQGAPIEIRYVLGDHVARTAIVIYDIRGRRVRLLQPQSRNPGSHLMLWDRLDHKARRVPRGVYLVQLLVDGEPFTLKSVLVR